MKYFSKIKNNDNVETLVRWGASVIMASLVCITILSITAMVYINSLKVYN